jgi:N-acetylneuraminate synthase/N,N'-diacetyllegionaminate synthase
VSALVRIGDRAVGGGEAPLVIAEAGVNHDGSVERARQLVRAAAEAGADAVKFQTFRADALVTADAAQAAYQRDRSPAASQREMLRALELPEEAWAELQGLAIERGILFLSTPFDVASALLLEDLGVPALKIGSGDLTNLVLLRAVAAFGRPLLLSTGMATLAEIDAAVGDLRLHGDPPLVLLQCTSAYPAPVEAANLRAMTALGERYGVPVGFSDHTPGIGAAVAAAALGAAVIEKHITLDRTLPGPDHAASLEPAEFASMSAAIRDAAAALGSAQKEPLPVEAGARAVARRSLVAARPLAAGELLAEADLDAMRPEGGISPLRIEALISRRLVRSLQAGEALRPTDLDPPLED